MATRKPSTKPIAKKTTSTTKKTTEKKPVAKKPVAEKKPATRKPKVEKTTAPKLKVKAKTPKEIATEKGEPWVSVLQVELDPDNIGNGAFELDWNDKFIANLVRAGYQAQANEPDSVIVDRWFQTICRNILAENYEQWAANQTTTGRSSFREDLGGGKTGVS